MPRFIVELFGGILRGEKVMRFRLLVVVGLILAGFGAENALLACGDKFLVVSRGTRFARAGVARPPAAILVYANPTLTKALDKTAVETLKKAGYKPTAVTGVDELDKALRQGGWDLVVTDLAEGSAIRGRLQGNTAPALLPVAYQATGIEVAQAKKDFQRVLKGPVKSQAFLDAVDDVIADRMKQQKSAAAD
jgi:hypothetical protein